MRDFEWNISMVMEKEANAAKLDKDSTKSEAELKMVCEQSFKDVYAAYAHVRVKNFLNPNSIEFRC